MTFKQIVLVLKWDSNKSDVTTRDAGYCANSYTPGPENGRRADGMALWAESGTM